MNIVSTLSSFFLFISGRTRIKKGIAAMKDWPICMSCNKTTRKLVNNDSCYQCYYHHVARHK